MYEILKYGFETLKITIMIRVGRYIYRQAPTGDWLKVAKIVYGTDGEYYQWFA